MKARELMKEIKELNVNELIKFKKLFDKYCAETVEALGGGTPYSVPTTPVTPVVPIADKVEVKVEPVNKIGKDSSWKSFFGKVKESGIEMGDSTEKEGIILSERKDSNVGIIAALVGHRGKVTNMVWGTCYELPILFDKCSKDELKAYADQILANPPKGYQPAEHLANGQFYYDELEQGNFVCKIYDQDAGCFKHFGYMVDEDVVFFVNRTGNIVSNGLRYYFVKKWGNRPEKEDAILALLERAKFIDANIEEKDEYINDFNQFNNEWTTANDSSKETSQPNPMIFKDIENDVHEEYDKQQEAYFSRFEVDDDDEDYDDDDTLEL